MALCPCDRIRPDRKFSPDGAQSEEDSMERLEEQLGPERQVHPQPKQRRGNPSGLSLHPSGGRSRHHLSPLLPRRRVPALSCKMRSGGVRHCIAAAQAYLSSPKLFRGCLRENLASLTTWASPPTRKASPPAAPPRARRPRGRRRIGVQASHWSWLTWLSPRSGAAEMALPGRAMLPSPFHTTTSLKRTAMAATKANRPDRPYTTSTSETRTRRGSSFLTMLEICWRINSS
mmetsp:Transcript_36638/g.77880  ORF Transcript_36638/g.77880 Transcript_36638/m.77880 type:complete len:231 (+) Transcript_36638:36-728(+)